MAKYILNFIFLSAIGIFMLSIVIYILSLFIKYDITNVSSASIVTEDALEPDDIKALADLNFTITSTTNENPDIIPFAFYQHYWGYILHRATYTEERDMYIMKIASNFLRAGFGQDALMYLNMIQSPLRDQKQFISMWAGALVLSGELDHADEIFRRYPDIRTLKMSQLWKGLLAFEVGGYQSAVQLLQLVIPHLTRNAYSDSFIGSVYYKLAYSYYKLGMMQSAANVIALVPEYITKVDFHDTDYMSLLLFTNMRLRAFSAIDPFLMDFYNRAIPDGQFLYAVRLFRAIGTLYDEDSKIFRPGVIDSINKVFSSAVFASNELLREFVYDDIYAPICSIANYPNYRLKSDIVYVDCMVLAANLYDNHIDPNERDYINTKVVQDLRSMASLRLLLPTSENRARTLAYIAHVLNENISFLRWPEIRELVDYFVESCMELEIYTSAMTVIDYILANHTFMGDQYEQNFIDKLRFIYIWLASKENQYELMERQMYFLKHKGNESNNILYNIAEYLFYAKENNLSPIEPFFSFKDIKDIPIARSMVLRALFDKGYYYEIYKSADDIFLQFSELYNLRDSVDLELILSSMAIVVMNHKKIDLRDDDKFQAIYNRYQNHIPDQFLKELNALMM